MNQLLTVDKNKTMTSKEIAELVDSRHDKVKQSIDRLVERGVISKPPVGDGEKAANNVVEQVYLIGKRDSYVIVAQLSPEFTARLVDRWQELEGATPKQLDLSDPETLRMALLTYSERVITLTAKVAEQAPAVEFVERYVDSTGSKGFRQVCKLLKVKEPEFRAFLHDKQIMYKLGGEWMPFAAHIDAGRFEVKAGTAQNEHAFNSARFTPKGISWVAGEYAKYQIAEKA